MRPLDAGEHRLAGWLDRLAAALLARGGAAARQLLATCAGERALLVLDDARLQIEAQAGPEGGLQLRITAAGAAGPPARVVTTGAALRAVIDGRRLLDAAVADGTIDLRAPLPALLAFDELVRMALAAGPRDVALRTLWAEFEAEWPREDGPAACARLDRQQPDHGALCRCVPPEVQAARSPLAAAGDFGTGALP